MSKSISLPSYDISFGPIAHSLQNILDHHGFTQVGIVIDENTKEHCLPSLTGSVDHPIVISIPSGEKNKSINTCESIWQQMQSARLDRDSLLINLGGGVIGDMGGFAASCYMRGITFMQIPTTLLSQVDASVGGKLGVDFEGIKNFIGLFGDPLAVLIDPEFLVSLPFSELRSGYAEMIKHGLIADRSIWHKMISQENWKDYISLDNIYESVLVKKNVVIDDPKEKGKRKILNFGHSVGHALESLSFTTDKPLLHGEAIAIGMISESYLATKYCELTKDELTEIVNYIKLVYHDIHFSDLEWEEGVMPLIRSDKKNSAGKMLFSLLDSIGNCKFNIPVKEEDILESIAFCEDIF